MPSPFEAAWAARQGDLLTRFQEADGFLWEPQASPETGAPGRQPVADENGRRVPDTARVVIPIAGVWTEKGALLHVHGRSMADSTTRPVVALSPVLLVQLDALGQPIARGDRITRLRTGAIYRVTDVVPRLYGRGHLHLAGSDR